MCRKKTQFIQFWFVDANKKWNICSYLLLLHSLPSRRALLPSHCRSRQWSSQAASGCTHLSVQIIADLCYFIPHHGLILCCVQCRKSCEFISQTMKVFSIRLVLVWFAHFNANSSPNILDCIDIRLVVASSMPQYISNEVLIRAFLINSKSYQYSYPFRSYVILEALSVHPLVLQVNSSLAVTSRIKRLRSITEMGMVVGFTSSVSVWIGSGVQSAGQANTSVGWVGEPDR